MRQLKHIIFWISLSLLGGFLLIWTIQSQSNEKLSLPSSSPIKTFHWAPSDTIIRLAKGSDNWPLTWGADDDLYTAYGDPAEALNERA